MRYGTRALSCGFAHHTGRFQLLGFLGMLIGVPLFATLYYIVKRLAEYSLEQRSMPAETEAYIDYPLPEPKKSPESGEK